MTIERIQVPVDHPTVEAVTAEIHTPERRRGPAVLLTHGAGGDLDGAELRALAELVAGRGHRVVRVNLPYREAGQGGAPRADRSVAAFRQIVTRVRERLPEERSWVLGGKSYGGRVASMAVAEGLPAAGLLFYGYPLHPPGKRDKLRVSHWPLVPVRCLFLQGDRDPFCDVGLLEENLTKLPRRATLHVVRGGDHNLEVAASAAPDSRRRPATEVVAGLGDVVGGWLGGRE